MILSDAKMALTCAVIALFESSMYIFVFNWTPVLNQGGEVPPFGMIFSTFMMSCMVGASLCALFSNVQTKKMLCIAIVVAAAAMLTPAYAGMSDSLSKYNLWAFVLFEMCVGIYFPSICTLKSEAVPESHRATIYNLFRAPMNLIVVSVLLVNPDLVPTFKLVSSMLMLAGLIMGVMLALPEPADKSGETMPLSAGTKD